ncbi:methyl-accepting chemotaxis protein [uncultured Thiodictyon sp.]|uniref:methyl-accepting chemotaxis protein n=1 Tax=uncultured Thiodictyon sp. TaxID=1846217 RepID=UPI0025D81EC2|nr:methyl-accepting chemotaxis protein [uncultured Thiodictyon sp.]
MTAKLKLSTRILLGNLMPCLVFTLAVAAVYLESLGLQRNIVDNERAVAISEHGLNLQLQAAQMQRAARGILLNAEATHVEGYEKSKQNAANIFLELKQLVRDPGQLATLERLSGLVTAIAEATQANIARVKAGPTTEGARDVQISQGDELYQRFNVLAMQFFERESEIEQQYKANVRNGVAAVVRLSGLGLVVAFALSLAISIWLARNTSRSIKELISVVAASTNQIAATTEEHEGAMTQQASAVTETTATVEEMVATARINAEQAELATNSANQAQSTTREGLELVMHNESDMAAMEESMNAIAQKIIGLSEQAGQIGEIARVVGELAAETNMLALNAAVEAARAGEQGRGFAVVASEIRKLADQSKKSAERANQIVADIQKATNGMVMTAEDGSKITHATADSARLASQAFEKVIHLADALVQNAQQVLLNSKQQAVALTQIDIAMKNIDNGAREMSTGTAQIREGMAKLTGVASELNRML